MTFDMNGYTDVATRLDMAFHKFPELRIQETHREIVGVGENTYIAVRVTVWRTPDDPLPVVAEAWERWPGRTPFTQGSEYMNASTSAVGRALRFAGIGPSGPIASRDEVAVRRSETEPLPAQSGRTGEHPSGAGQATAKQIGLLRALMRARGVDNWTPPDNLTLEYASALIKELKEEQQ